MQLKDISYLELWWPFRWIFEEPFCEIILNFGLVVQQEILFKDISYLELWQPFVLWSGTLCAILVEGILRNNSVKLF